MLFTIKKILLCYDESLGSDQFSIREAKKIQSRIGCELEFVKFGYKLKKKLRKSSYCLIIVEHKIKDNKILGRYPSLTVVLRSLSPVLVIKKEILFHHLFVFIDLEASPEWMIVSSLDFFRCLHFQKITFVHFIHELHDQKIVESNLKEQVQSFLRPEEKGEVIVQRSSKNHVSLSIENFIKSHDVELAIVKKNSTFWKSESLKLLNADSCSLIIL